MGEVIGPLRDYLVAQGVVREPNVAGALPPMWLEPNKALQRPEKRRLTAPRPKWGRLVLGLYRAGGVAVGPDESSWRNRNVDLRIRSRTAPAVSTIEQAITPRIIDKYEWNTGGLQVIDSQLSRELQPVVIDSTGYYFVVGYRFTVYAP